ncbi:hypothetical protein BGZ95_004898, partial [Linnemannia exigua]
MGFQLIYVLAAVPFAVSLTSGAICAIASRSSAIRLGSSGPDHLTATPSTLEGPSVFNHTHLKRHATADNNDTNTDIQPKAYEIKVRSVLLFLLSLIPTAFVVVSLVLALLPGSDDRTIFQRLYAPLITLAGWLFALVLLLAMMTHRIRFANAIQPLQWFYSSTVGVLAYQFWIRLDFILEGPSHYTSDMWIFFALSATAFILCGIALTMPSELDFDFVHQFGYGYSS